MDIHTFKQLEVGDKVAMPDRQIVEVVSVQRQTDWDRWAAAGRPQGKQNEYPYCYTWAIETNPYHYVKIQDRVIARMRRA